MKLNDLDFSDVMMLAFTSTLCLFFIVISFAYWRKASTEIDLKKAKIEYIKNNHTDSTILHL